jgi:hypothetical protein
VSDHDNYAEPTAADLAAIEFEEPLIMTELEWLDAEIKLLDAIERGRASEMDVRRVRRAERAVIRETFTHVARLTCLPTLHRAA